MLIMQGSCLLLRVLVAAFLLFVSLSSTQPMTNPARNSAALLKSTAALSTPANCCTRLKRIPYFSQHTDCLPIMGNLYLVNRVLKTPGGNNEFKSDSSMNLKATSRICEASIVFTRPTVKRQIPDRVWLAVLHAFKVLHTDCVKTRKQGGSIAITDPATVGDICYVTLRPTSTIHKTANTEEGLITDPLLTHTNDPSANTKEGLITDPLLTNKNDPESPKVHPVESLENIPASAGVLAKFAALRRLCSTRPPGGYVRQDRKEACHAFCEIATGACAFAATLAYSTHHSYVGVVTLGVGGTMQAVKGIATGLAIKGKEDSAHSLVGELTSIAIQERGITVRSPEVEITYVKCFGDPLRSHPDINTIGCRDAISKLQFDLSGPKGSATWRQISESSYRTLQRTKFDTSHCTLEFELRTHEKAIWEYAPSMIKRLSDECLSKGYSGGLVVLKAKNAKQSLLDITIRSSLARDPGRSETDALVPKEDKVKHFCSLLPKQGCMSKKWGNICQVCCRCANVGCCVIGGIMIATGHPNIGGSALPMGVALSEGENYFRYLSSKPKTEEEHAEASYGDHIVKHRRSIDSGRPKVPIARGSIA